RPFVSSFPSTTLFRSPSAHDRDKLRSVRRMPQFKARPLNPKVFTSAGDLGVPRIQKQPLTVPVSPVFNSHSRTRIKKTRDAVLRSEEHTSELQSRENL